MDLVDLIIYVEEHGKELVEASYVQAAYDRASMHFFGSDACEWLLAKITRVNMTHVGNHLVGDGMVPVVFWPPYNSTRCFSIVLGYVEEVVKTGPLGRRIARKAQSFPYRWLLLLTLDRHGKPTIAVRDTEDEPVFNPVTKGFEFFNVTMAVLDLRGEKANIICNRPELKYVREKQLAEVLEREVDI